MFQQKVVDMPTAPITENPLLIKILVFIIFLVYFLEMSVRLRVV